MLRFAISASAIDGVAEAARLTDPRAGALATFEGWIRNHNEGSAVAALEYEVFEALAQSEGDRILAEAAERFGLHGAVCVHRSGALAIGEMAVWVGVTASHRGEAFRACRYIIDEIKTRLPIWKRETYGDGRVEWVNCKGCADHAGHARHEEELYYSRQSHLPQMGAEGQAKLKAAKILVVGVGGLGAAAAQALAGAGVGKLALCDFDTLHESNLHRQFLYAHADSGQKKVELAAKRLRDANPFIAVTIHAERFAFPMLDGCDVVLDCSDNLETKLLLNDACMAAGIRLVSASVHRFDGQLLTVDPANEAGCLRCLWPEIVDPSAIDTCSRAGVLGAMPALLGTMQALEAVKLILGLAAPSADNLVLFDATSLQTVTLKRARLAGCPICAGNPATAARKLWELDISALRARGLDDFALLDLRAGEPVGLKPDVSYLAFCEQGRSCRAFAAARQAEGWTGVHAALCSADELAELTAAAGHVQRDIQREDRSMSLRDISDRPRGFKRAVAAARLSCSQTLSAETLAMARVAAIQAAKQAGGIIPTSYPAAIEFVEVLFTQADTYVDIHVEVRAIQRAGVDSEALLAAAAAAVAIHGDIDGGIEVTIEALLLLDASEVKLKTPGSVRAGVLVMSDSVAGGEKQDISGGTIRERLIDHGVGVAQYLTIADDPATIESTIRGWCEQEKLDLIITTGGTGVGPRDTTPEVLDRLLQRRLPGVEEAMRAFGQERTPFAMLSRSCAGQFGQTVIVALPGSPRAVGECLDILLPTILHAVPIMHGGGH